jgi:hypothetical protein
LLLPASSLMKTGYSSTKSKLVISMRYYRKSDLKPGLLVKDPVTNDLGFLVERFDIMKGWEHEEIWVWDMYWAGPTTDFENCMIPFIEEALLSLLNAGEWVIVEKDDE